MTNNSKWYGLRVRFIAPHESYKGCASKEWQCVGMIQPHSSFAHVIFSGSFDELIEFIKECNKTELTLRTY